MTKGHCGESQALLKIQTDVKKCGAEGMARPLGCALRWVRHTFPFTPTAFEILTGFSITWIESLEDDEEVVSEVVVVEVW